jgi:hypothetical protein
MAETCAPEAHVAQRAERSHRAMVRPRREWNVVTRLAGRNPLRWQARARRSIHPSSEAFVIQRRFDPPVPIARELYDVSRVAATLNDGDGRAPSRRRPGERDESRRRAPGARRCGEGDFGGPTEAPTPRSKANARSTRTFDSGRLTYGRDKAVSSLQLNSHRSAAVQINGRNRGSMASPSRATSSKVGISRAWYSSGGGALDCNRIRSQQTVVDRHRHDRPQQAIDVGHRVRGKAGPVHPPAP